MLSTAASNALLKTLEEPPAHVIFVLATTDPQKVLPTIRSRTQHFEFRLLGPETLGELLDQVRRDAHLDVPDEAFDLAVRRGRGSARDALSVLDQVAASDSVDDDLPELDEVVEALAERDVGRALVAVAHLTSAGFSPQQLAGDLVDYLRQGFLALVAPELVAVSGTERDALGLAGRAGGTGRPGPGHGGPGPGPGGHAGRPRPPGQPRGGPGPAGPPRGRRLARRRCWPASSGWSVRCPAAPASVLRPRRHRHAPAPRTGTRRPLAPPRPRPRPAPTAGAAVRRRAPAPTPAPARGDAPSAAAPRKPGADRRSQPTPAAADRRGTSPPPEVAGGRPAAEVPVPASRTAAVPHPRPAGAGMGRPHHRPAPAQGQGAVPGRPVRRRGGDRPSSGCPTRSTGTAAKRSAGTSSPLCPSIRPAGAAGPGGRHREPGSPAPRSRSASSTAPERPGRRCSALCRHRLPVRPPPGPCSVGASPRRTRTCPPSTSPSWARWPTVDNSAEARVMQAFPGAEEVG